MTTRLSSNECYILTISGCPNIFSSHNIGTDFYETVFNNSEFPRHKEKIQSGSNYSQFFTSQGSLAAESIGNFSEEVDFLNSNFMADGVTFKIHDIPWVNTSQPSGSSPVNIATSLFTNKNQTTLQLNDTIENGSEYSTVTIKTTSPILEGKNEHSYLWIENEAFVVEPFTALTQTFTAKRSALGTKPARHAVVEADNYRPTVFFDYPGPYKQKVLLWRRSEDGVWSILWRGFGGRAPRASGNGAPIELQCEHFWTVFKEKKYDITEAKTTLTGYDARRMYFRKWVGSIGSDWTMSVGSFDHMTKPLDYTNTAGVRIVNYSSPIANAFESGAYFVFFQNTGPGQIFNGWRSAVDNKKTLREGYWAAVVPPPNETSNRIELVGVYGVPGGPAANHTRAFGISDEPTNSALDEGAKVLKAPVPQNGVFQVFSNNSIPANNDHLIISGIDSLNTFDFVYSGSVATCLVRTVWVGEIDEEDYEPAKRPAGFTTAMDPPIIPDGEAAGLNPDSRRHEARIMHYYPSGSYDWARQNEIRTNLNPKPLFFASGSAVFRNSDFNKFNEYARPVHFVTSEVDLEHKLSLKSGHWIDLARYGIINYFNFQNDFDFSSFSSYFDIKLKSPKLITEILVDSDTSSGDIVQPIASFYGYFPTTTTNAKMRFAELIKPNLTTSSSWSITTKDFIKSKNPAWEDYGDSVVTSIKVSSEGLPKGGLFLKNQNSRAKYGDNQSIEIDLSKLGIETYLFSSKTKEEQLSFLSSQLYSRFFDFFSEPYTRYTFYLPLFWSERLYPGMIVTISDWLLPNGTGGRGLDQTKLLIEKKVTSLNEGYVEIRGIAFPRIQPNKGFSPCVKISSIDIGAKTLTVTGSYLGLTNDSSDIVIRDYAASNRSNYLGGTNNDNGIGWFQAGMKCQLILRNSTTFATASVSLTNVSSPTITISDVITTGSVNWPAQAVSGNVDLRFDRWNTSGLTTEQKKWYYIADGEDRLILDERVGFKFSF